MITKILSFIELKGVLKAAEVKTKIGTMSMFRSEDGGLYVHGEDDTGLVIRDIAMSQEAADALLVFLLNTAGQDQTFRQR